MAGKAEPKFLGVAAWLANKFDVDVTIIRIVFIAAVLFGVGFPILIYFILYFVKDE